MYRTVIRNPSSILHSVDSIEGKKENKISAIFKQCTFLPLFPKVERKKGGGEKGRKERRKSANREIEKIDGTPVPFVTRG